jgi:alpha 1,3-glucosidase
MFLCCFKVRAYIPAGRWFSWDTLSELRNAVGWVVLQAPLTHIPVFIRGGSIVVRQDRLRRSSTQMQHDPFTIVVAPSATQSAHGHLYWDDGESFDYRSSTTTSSSSSLRSLNWNGSLLTNTPSTAYNRTNHIRWSGFDNTVERILIAGVNAVPEHVAVVETQLELEWVYDASRQVLTIRNPGLAMGNDWNVQVK